MAVGDGQQADLRVVRGNDFEWTVLNLRQLELHVALPSEHPNVADEDVVENKSFAFVFDRNLLWATVRWNGG